MVLTVSELQVPQFEIHHRLGLALEAAGITPEQMAEELGVHKNTVYNYTSGRSAAKLVVIKQWARVCSVPWEWIVSGERPDLEDPGSLVRSKCNRAADLALV